jgi:hypothetical protein
MHNAVTSLINAAGKIPAIAIASAKTTRSSHTIVNRKSYIVNA